MRTLVRSPFARFALLAAPVLAVLAGCASSSGGGNGNGGPPRSIAVSLIGYGPVPFQLASESRLSRVELYSTELDHASTKVVADEVMAALVERLDDVGFAAHSRPGHAPAGVGSGGTIAKAIQVEDDGSSAWWPLVATASASELRGFQTAVRDFLGIYNISQSWQSVDNTLGGEYFDRAKAAGKH